MSFQYLPTYLLVISNNLAFKNLTYTYRRSSDVTATAQGRGEFKSNMSNNPEPVIIELQAFNVKIYDCIDEVHVNFAIYGKPSWLATK